MDLRATPAIALGGMAGAATRRRAVGYAAASLAGGVAAAYLGILAVT